MKKKIKVRGSKKQHAQLDAEYKAMLLPKESPMAFWNNLYVLNLWGEEKHYLSQYGKRFPSLTFRRHKVGRNSKIT